MSPSKVLQAGFVVGGLVSSAALAQGGITAGTVVNYNAGTVLDSYWGTPYTTASAALGLPDLTENVPNINDSSGNPIAFADNSAITPFNSEYNPNQVVAISGAGGTLTLQLSSPITIGSGAALGIHAAVGLQDANYPNGLNLDPAQTYTNPRQADLQVSSDGVNWVDLGTKTFDAPTNIFVNATDPTGATPGTAPANFFQPFFGTLSNFDDQDFGQTLAILNGSAGGNWFDLSGLSLTTVDFVRLSTSAGESMYVDSVLADPGATSPPATPPPPPGIPPSPPSPPPPSTSAVPLPSAAGMAGIMLPFAGLAFIRRRRAMNK